MNAQTDSRRILYSIGFSKNSARVSVALDWMRRKLIICRADAFQLCCGLKHTNSCPATNDPTRPQLIDCAMPGAPGGSTHMLDR
jgi:hypothetical protein